MCSEDDGVTDGSITDSYLFHLSLSLPVQDNPTEYQGVYPYDEDASTWGPEPASNLLIGFSSETEGYTALFGGMASDAGVCISRIRPDRVEGSLWWTAPDDRPEWGGPYYITFDVGNRGPNASDFCFSTNYEFGLEETDVWPQLAYGE